MHELTANFIIEPVFTPAELASTQYCENPKDADDKIHLLLLYADLLVDKTRALVFLQTLAYIEASDAQHTNNL